MENIMVLNCEDICLLVWIFVDVLFLICILTYKSNTYKTAKKLIPYIGVKKSFTYSNSIFAKDPFATQPINEIMIMDIAPNLDNEYYVKYTLNGKIKTLQVDYFIEEYGEYYNL